MRFPGGEARQDLVARPSGALRMVRCTLQQVEAEGGKVKVLRVNDPSHLR